MTTIDIRKQLTNQIERYETELGREGSKGLLSTVQSFPDTLAGYDGGIMN